MVNLDPKDPMEVSYRHPVGKDPTGRDHPALLRYPADRQHSGTIVDHISHLGWMAGGYAARWKDEDMALTLLKRAESFVKRNRDRPFFLYYAPNDVHVPRAPNGRFLGTSQCGIRGDAIEELDWCMGQFMSTLRRLKLADKTLVISMNLNLAAGRRPNAQARTPALRGQSGSWPGGKNPESRDCP